jgi:hypothetical protein
LVVIVFIISSIIAYFNSKDIEKRLAWKGASPHNYVAQKLHPENFKKNWEAAGVGKYDFSLPMRIFYYLAKYCNIDPGITAYASIYLQTFLFFISIAFLSQVLFNQAITTILIIAIISSSNLAGINLSRFGSGYASSLSWPLFYGFANSFRFFSFGFFLKKNYIVCFIFLALSFYCHVNMGIFAFVFIFSYFVYNKNDLKQKSFLRGILIFVVLIAPHILYILFNTNLSAGGIAKDQWIKSTQIFSYHWYPVTMKLFSEKAKNEFFPIILTCLALFMSTRYLEFSNQKYVKIFTGCLGCLIMSIAGVVFSEFIQTPFLIKISFQRSSGLITLFGVIFFIYYLVEKFRSAKLGNILLGTYSLFILICSKPGIAVLPLLIFLIWDLKEGYFGYFRIKDNIRKILLIIVGTILFVISFISILSIMDHIAETELISNLSNLILRHLWQPLKLLNPLESFDYLLRGGKLKNSLNFVLFLFYIAFVFALFIIFNNKARQKHKILSMLSLPILLIVFSFYFSNIKYKRWYRSYYDLSSSYLDMQLWAKHNTRRDSLFMTDPTSSYGWRDFSERSSFGNLREWGYSCITYNPSLKKFNEGLRRMKEFGVDIDKISLKDIKLHKSFPYSRKFKKKGKDLYYNSGDSWRINFAEKYGIDYFIMRKDFFNAKNKLPKIYENEHYVLLASK